MVIIWFSYGFPLVNHDNGDLMMVNNNNDNSGFPVVNSGSMVVNIVVYYSGYAWQSIII